MIPLALFSEPPPLPPHPALEHWLLENALYPALALAALALLLFFTLRSSARPGAARDAAIAGAALLLAAIAVFLVDAAVETRRESALRTVQTFVGAASTGDAAAADSALARSVSVRAAGAPIQGIDRDWLLNAIPAIAASTEILGSEIQRNRADLDPSGQRAVANLRVTAGGDGQGRAITWWRVELARADDTWRIDGLDLLLVNGDPPSGMSGAFRRYGDRRP